jgi:hypothetical protein
LRGHSGLVAITFNGVAPPTPETNWGDIPD